MIFAAGQVEVWLNSPRNGLRTDCVGLRSSSCTSRPSWLPVAWPANSWASTTPLLGAGCGYWPTTALSPGARRATERYDGRVGIGISGSDGNIACASVASGRRRGSGRQVQIGQRSNWAPAPPRLPREIRVRVAPSWDPPRFGSRLPGEAVAHTKSGDDKATFDNYPASTPGDVFFKTGPGNDRVEMLAFSNNSGNVKVSTGRGNDVVWIEEATVGGNLDISTSSGDDSVFLYLFPTVIGTCDL